MVAQLYSLLNIVQYVIVINSDCKSPCSTFLLDNLTPYYKYIVGSNARRDCGGPKPFDYTTITTMIG